MVMENEALLWTDGRYFLQGTHAIAPGLLGAVLCVDASIGSDTVSPL